MNRANLRKSCVEFAVSEKLDSFAVFKIYPSYNLVILVAGCSSKESGSHSMLNYKGENVYYIVIDKDLERSEFINVFAHEFVHFISALYGGHHFNEDTDKEELFAYAFGNMFSKIVKEVGLKEKKGTP